MDESTKQRYKLLIADELKHHRPQDADKAEAIVDRLFNLPQMQDETSVLLFIDKYRQAIARGVGNG